jgi:hypothetical protein
VNTLSNVEQQWFTQPVILTSVKEGVDFQLLTQLLREGDMTAII